jgi:hypothetical protein
MDFILNNEIYLYLSQYIDVGMAVIVPCLIFIGYLLKNTPKVSDWMIPYILIALGIASGITITGVVMTGIVQGILVAAVAVLGHQLYKQWLDRK